jgi:hypothetical protein
MKNSIKLFVFATITILGSNTLHAQSNSPFYASVNTSYNYGIGAKEFDNKAAWFSLANGDNVSTTLSNLNLGSGFKAGLIVGYDVNPHIAVELGVDYLISNTIQTKENYNPNYYNNDLKSKMLQLKPTLVLKAGYEKINPYTKIGMVIGNGKITKEENSKYKDEGNNDVYRNATFEFSGGTPIGFTASIGSTYKINEKITLFGELNMVNLTYAPQKGKYTKYTENGVDMLPTIPVRSKEYEFTDIIQNGGYSNDQPQKSFNTPFSFSSIGINIGMQYHF